MEEATLVTRLVIDEAMLPYISDQTDKSRREALLKESRKRECGGVGCFSHETGAPATTLAISSFA